LPREQGRDAIDDQVRDESTAAKHGQNVMAVLRDAISGQPWMPPRPAPT